MPELKKLITPPNKGGEFELIPPGVYLARCYRMVDLGTQRTEYKGQSKNVRQILIGWEILQDDDGEDVRMEDAERVFTIHRIYTWSMNQRSTLRKDLNAWRGRAFTDDEANEFEVSKLLGQFCKLQIAHSESNDRTYANVIAVYSTKKTAEPVNELFVFSLDDFDVEAFSELPEWLQEKIGNAEEYRRKNQATFPAEPVKQEPAQQEMKQENPLDIADVPFTFILAAGIIGAVLTHTIAPWIT